MFFLQPPYLLFNGTLSWLTLKQARPDFGWFLQYRYTAMVSLPSYNPDKYCVIMELLCEAVKGLTETQYYQHG